MDFQTIIAERYMVADFIAIIGDKFPLLAKYKETEQDSQWHAEGDVEIHTDMVLTQVYDFFEADLAQWPLNEKAIMVMGALFHDYAKPICTKLREINGIDRVVAPNHENKGASLLFYTDPPLGISVSQWQEAIALTALHHIPKLLVNRDKPKADYLALSTQGTTCEKLFWLEQADMRGRTCEDKDEQIFILDMFADNAKEYGIWDTSATDNEYQAFVDKIMNEFPDASKEAQHRVLAQAIYHYEQGSIFMLEEELARAYQYIDKQSHVVVLCGVSGTGKTSITADFAARSYEIISLDDIRVSHFKFTENQKHNDNVVRIAKERLKDALREKRNVVYDATSLRRDFRTAIVGLSTNYSAFTEIVVVHKNGSDIKKDNKDRAHPVPDDVLKSQFEQLQLPEHGDAHVVNFLYGD